MQNFHAQPWRSRCRIHVDRRARSALARTRSRQPNSNKSILELLSANNEPSASFGFFERGAAARRDYERALGIEFDEIVADRILPRAIERAGALPHILDIAIAARARLDPFEELHDQELRFARHGSDRRGRPAIRKHEMRDPERGEEGQDDPTEVIVSVVLIEPSHGLNSIAGVTRQADNRPTGSPCPGR